MTYIPADLRREVVLRARGCCEYCRRGQDDVLFTFHIEHIISEKHGGKTDLSNLALSCPSCNAYKGTDIAGADPETGLPTFLFHPRQQRWEEHFRLDDAVIQPLSAEGRVTVLLLRLNSLRHLAERRLLLRARRYPCAD